MTRHYNVDEYTLTDPKIKIEMDIVQISDIHSDPKNLQMAYNIAKAIGADAVLITGDLFDSVNDPRNEEIVDIITRESKIIKTVIQPGNHDYAKFTVNEKGKRIEVPAKENVFFDEFKSNKEIITFTKPFDYAPLNDQIDLYAFNMPIESYEKDDFSTFDYEGLIKTAQVDEKKYSILMTHYYNTVLKRLLTAKKLPEEVQRFLKLIVLILSGHMHAGCTPPALRNYEEGNHRGILAPYAHIAQKDAYGIVYNDIYSVLVSGGMTKFATSSEIGKIANFLANLAVSEIELIHLVPGKEHNMTFDKIVKLSR